MRYILLLFISLLGCGKSIVDPSNTTKVILHNSLDYEVEIIAYLNNKLVLNDSINSKESKEFKEPSGEVRPPFGSYDSLITIANGMKKTDYNCYIYQNDNITYQKCNRDSISLFNISRYTSASPSSTETTYTYTIDQSDYKELK
ncbi:MAG: hypothetical protein H7259_02790 [Cytophagales bacterium]|nr:hypothetical protein [Cytophaga sp.]